MLSKLVHLSLFQAEKVTRLVKKNGKFLLELIFHFFCKKQSQKINKLWSINHA